MDKFEIRRRVLALRDNLSDAERKRGRVLLTERVLGHQWFYGSDTLLGFASYGSEIDTGEILREAIRRGKKVYLPKVEVCRTAVEREGTADKKISEFGDCPEIERCPEMVFLRINDLEELQAGYRGIPEPDRGAEAYVYRAETAGHVLMLMPGVAFDRYRNRIGYGKGFYDRFLADKKDLQNRTIAVGFKCQLVEEEIVCGEYDIKPYQVLCI